MTRQGSLTGCRSSAFISHRETKTLMVDIREPRQTFLLNIRYSTSDRKPPPFALLLSPAIPTQCPQWIYIQLYLRHTISLGIRRLYSPLFSSAAPRRLGNRPSPVLEGCIYASRLAVRQLPNLHVYSDKQHCRTLNMTLHRARPNSTWHVAILPRAAACPMHSPASSIE